MSEEYKTLAEMGIEEVSEIEKFSTRQEGDMDILKIYFYRDPGEWFAKSKKFKFKRQVKTVRVNEGKVSYRETSESSPYFLRALSELEKLSDKMHSVKGRKEILLEEVDHLEKVMERKIADIRRQIEEL